jgi:hypothetical protein
MDMVQIPMATVMIVIEDFLGPQSMPLVVLGLVGMIQVTLCHIPTDFSIEDLVGRKVLSVTLESLFG